MNLDKSIPLRFFINLGRRDDRRANTERTLYEARIEAERFPAIDHHWLNGRTRGYESPQRYACALSHRLAIREAKRRKAPAVLIFEDDVVLDPNFLAKLESIDIPDDWDLLFFGCTHTQRPTPLAPGLVQVHAHFDSHCYAVRAKAFDQVLSGTASSKSVDQEKSITNDAQVSNLLGTLKGYACFPNLAWQAVSQSHTLASGTHSNYNQNGSQVNYPEMVRGVAAENLGCQAWQTICQRDDQEEDQEPKISGCSNPRVGLLFLTRGDHLSPDLWTEYLETADHHPAVYVHAKSPADVNSTFLKKNLISDHIPTKWADVSLVKATLSLIQAALENQDLTHFVLLSESCVPTKPYSALLSFLKIDSRSWISFKDIHQVRAENLVKATRFNTLPHVPTENQKFQDQWMMISREVAEILVQNDISNLFEKVFAPDETYFISLLDMMGYPLGKIINEPITWTKWKPDAGHPNHYETRAGHHWSEVLRSPGFFARKFSLLEEK